MTEIKIKLKSKRQPIVVCFKSYNAAVDLVEKAKTSKTIEFEDLIIFTDDISFIQIRMRL